MSTKLGRARALLKAECPASAQEGEDKLGDTWLEQMLALTGEDLSVCPRCGVGKMIRTLIKPGTSFPEHSVRRNTS